MKSKWNVAVALVLAIALAIAITANLSSDVQAAGLLQVNSSTLNSTTSFQNQSSNTSINFSNSSNSSYLYSVTEFNNSNRTSINLTAQSNTTNSTNQNNALIELNSRSLTNTSNSSYTLNLNHLVLSKTRFVLGEKIFFNFSGANLSNYDIFISKNNQILQLFDVPGNYIEFLPTSVADYKLELYKNTTLAFSINFSVYTNYTTPIATVDKKVFYLNEPIEIKFLNLEPNIFDYNAELESSQSLYKFIGTLSKNLTLRKNAVGNYTFTLFYTNKNTPEQNGTFKLNFSVISPISQQGSGLIAVYTDKKTYKLGEVVKISFSNSTNVSDYDVVISSDQSSYRFLGLTEGTLSFYPKTVSSYKVSLKLADDILASAIFNVTPSNSTSPNNNQSYTLLPNTFYLNTSVNFTFDFSDIFPTTSILEKLLMLNRIEKVTAYVLGQENNSNFSIIVLPKGRNIFDTIIKSNPSISQGDYTLRIEAYSGNNIFPKEQSFSWVKSLTLVSNQSSNQSSSQTQNTGDNSQWEEIRKTTIKNSRGEIQSARFEYFRKYTQSELQSMQQSSSDSQFVNLTNMSNSEILSNKFNVNLKFDKGPIKSITLKDASLEKGVNVGIDEPNLQTIQIHQTPNPQYNKKRVEKSYAIDPTTSNFSIAEVKLIAKGTELYKCAQWNFTEQTCYGQWVKILDIIPGTEYTINITATDPGYAETGVASINTEKSIYHPNETVKIIIVVLDNLGYLVHNANVTLQILSPTNFSYIYSTSSPSPSKIYESSNGIYTVNFSSAIAEGNYSLYVSAVGFNLNSTMISYFTVKSFYEFDILRTTPVTIDPWQGPFNSTIKLVSFLGVLEFNYTEILPINFSVENQGGASLFTVNNSYALFWSNLSNNSVVSYSASAPKVTPYLYEIGKSYVTYSINNITQIFTESRPWYMAIDPLVNYTRFNVTDTISGHVRDTNCGGTGAAQALMNSGTAIQVGDTTTGSGREFKIFLSFNTSYLPDNATIDNATLYVYLNTMAWEGGEEVHVYSCNYGTTLDNSDFENTVMGYDHGAIFVAGQTTGQFQALNITVTGNNISKTANTQLCLEITQGCIDTGDLVDISATTSATYPYLMVGYTTKFPSVIEFKPPTPNNATLTYNTTVQINTSINSDYDLVELKYNWNGTNYTFYNHSLNLMMNFDNLSIFREGSNSNLTHDSSIAQMNGTCVGMNSNCNWTNGVYGKAISFDGLNDHINFTRILYLNASTFTTSAWFKTNVAHDGKILSTNSTFHQMQVINGHFRICINGCSEGTKNVSDGQWHFAVVMGNRTGIYAYLDGNNSPEITQALYAQRMNGIPRIGAVGAGPGSTAPSLYFNGQIDELRVWNISFSTDEIELLYFSNLQEYNPYQWYLYVNQTKNTSAGLDSGTYTYQVFAKDALNFQNASERRQITIDSTPPTISQNYPQNGYWNDSSSPYNVTFNCSISDNLNSTNISLYLTNNLNASFIFNDSCNINSAAGSCRWNKSLILGNYTWNCLGNDVAGLSDWGINYSLKINFTPILPPNISQAQCEEVGVGWISCTGFGYGDTFGGVRANCTSMMGGTIDNVTFSLKNLQDNQVYFNTTITTQTGNLWVYDVLDFQIFDSGDFNLQITCKENPTSVQDINWSIPFGSLIIQILTPNITSNLTKDYMFAFSALVNCTGGECGDIQSSAYHSSNELGVGSSGQLTITTANTIVNNYTYLTQNASSGDLNITVFNATQFRAGDEILIIQMQNATFGTAGLYEFITIQSVTGNNITLVEGLSNNYYTGIFNSSNSTSTQIIRVAQYRNLTINSGASITSPAWNGWTGGIIVIKAIGTVNITGNINATGKGFRAGDGIIAAAGPQYAFQGESFTGIGINTYTANKGGGGGGYNDISAGSGASGAGGSYFISGFAGSNSPEGQQGGLAGISYGNSELSLLFPGSGGGGGGSDNNGATDGVAGGSGGGIVYVSANKILTAGAIFSDGINGRNSGSQWAGSGGGGSGGSIYLNAINLTIGSNLINATGGRAGCGTTYCGGNGSVGRISLSFSYLNGVSNPLSGYNGTGPSTIYGFDLISIIDGYTPFYTTTSNPLNSSSLTCLSNMQAGNSCNVTWQVNSSGQQFTKREFFIRASPLNYTSNVTYVDTIHLNYTITENTPPTVVSVNITPSIPTIRNNLTCNFLISDINTADSLFANVSWYKNGIRNISFFISVSNGALATSILYSTNLSAGQNWYCNVTPYDGRNFGTSLNSSSVTILASSPPVINSVQCSKLGVWQSCSNILYGDTLEAIRANCTSADATILNITFNLTNLEDNYLFFSNITTLNQTSNFILNNTNLLIQDSGTFSIGILCRDNASTSSNSTVQWSVPWGTLVSSLISPLTNVNVTYYSFFNFTSNVTCIGGECGYINATIDPLPDWWNSSFRYRKQLTVLERAGKNLTDYQVRVTIDTQSLISQGKLNSSCNDIRFTDNVSTQLNYFVESGCNATNTTVWVKVPSIRSNTTTILYFYYGNSSVISQSSGRGAMFIYENMTVVPEGSIIGDAAYVDSNTGVRLTTASGNLLGYIYYSRNPGNGFYGRYRTWAGGGTGADSTWFGVHDTSVSSTREDIVYGGYHFTVDEWQDRIAFTKSTTDNGASIQEWSSTTLDNSAWHTFEVYFYNSGTFANALIYYDGTLVVNGTDNTPNAITGQYFLVGGRTGGSTNEHRVSNISVRSYVRPEPNVTMGTEIPNDKGDIPMNSGTPFYTTTTNPMGWITTSCLGNMKSGNTCNTTWTVNATGQLNLPYEFFVTYSAFNYSGVYSNTTRKVNITTINNFAPNLSSVTLSPAYAYDTENLTCGFYIYDFNSFDILNATVRWYKNRALNYTQTLTNLGNGVFVNATLGDQNTSVGDSWICAVTPGDGRLLGIQINSSNSSVTSVKPPKINSIECLKNNTIWTSCSNLAFNDRFAGVRANCTPQSANPVRNVTFNFTNIPDNNTYFYNLTTLNSSVYWIFYKNITINDSGDFFISALCKDNTSASDYSTVSWALPWGYFTSNLITPSANGDVEKNAFFTFTATISCVGGECGDAIVTLDPQDASSGYASFSPISSFNPSSAISSSISPINSLVSPTLNSITSLAYPSNTIPNQNPAKKGGNSNYPNGIATLNSEKSTYKINDTAKIYVVLLNNLGEFITDGDFILTITNPNGKKETFTTLNFNQEKPGLYSIRYNKLLVEGDYSLKLENIANGNLQIVNSLFNVNSNLLFDSSSNSAVYFDIIRNAPLAINPWEGTFDLEIKIVSNVNSNSKSIISSNFILTELIPLSLDVKQAIGADIWKTSKGTSLVWYNLTNNSVVKYKIAAPLISPEIYSLRAMVTHSKINYFEPRPWMIAADPINYYTSFANKTQSSASGTYTQANGGGAVRTAVADCSGGTCTSANSWITGLINFGTQPQTCELNATLSFNISDLNPQYIRNATLTWAGCWDGDEVLTNNHCAGTNNPEFSSGTGGGSFDMRILNNSATTKLDCIDTVGSECGAGDEINLGTSGVAPSWGAAEAYHTFRFQKTNFNSNYVLNGLINITWRVFGTAVCGDTAALNDILMVVDYANLTLGWEYTIKSGAVSTVVGADPFYTTNANPQNFSHQSCLQNMIAGISCNITWQVNATGGLNTTHTFYLEYNSSDYPQYVSKNTSRTVNLTIRDTSGVPPSVSLLLPSNGRSTNNNSVFFNCSATDNSGLYNLTLYGNFSGIWAENESRRISGLSNYSNYTLSLNDGSYKWNCLAFDTHSNSKFANSNFTVTVDTVAPQITLLYPEPLVEYFTSTLVFNFSVVDNIDNSLTCNITIDGTVRDNGFSATNGLVTSRTISNLNQSTHFWNVSCVDDAGNLNKSLSSNFSISEIAPNVTLITPTNTYTNDFVINLYFNATDNNDVTFAYLLMNEALEDTIIDPLDNTAEFFTLTDYPEGVYSWTVNVSDISNLTAQAVPRILYIDYTPAFINQTAPENDSVWNVSSLYFNYTVTDNYSPNAYCTIYVNSTVVDFNYSASNGTRISRPISGITDGDHVWNMSCQDRAGNINSTGLWFFHIYAPPTVSLNYPADNYSQSSGTLSLNYTPTDNTNINTCYLTLNGQRNMTNSSLQNGNMSKFILSNLVEGYYNWSITCNDTFALNTTSSLRNFIIDGRAPTINLSAPSHNSVVYARLIEFNFTAFDNLDSSLLCNVTVDGSVRQSNLPSINGSLTNVTINITYDGRHYWNVTCIDDARNINTSSTWNFTSWNPPDVYLIWPTDNVFISYNQNVNFTYQAFSTTGIANTSLIINGLYNKSNTSAITGSYNYFFLNFSTDGRYTWTINATDLNNLVGTASPLRFVIDTTPPNVTYTTPYSNQTLAWNNVTFNFTVKDIFSDALRCNITVNGTMIYSNQSIVNNSNFLFYRTFPDGVYNWSVICTDNATNSNTLQIINFSVEAPPNITLNFPYNNYRSNNQNISFNYTPYDVLGLENCTLILNGTPNISSSSILKNYPNYLNLTSIPEGDYNWTIRCLDLAPDLNSYTPIAKNFSIDLSGPIINLIYPPAQQTFNINNITFNWTATDYAGTTVTCNINLSDSPIARNGTVIAVSGSYFTATFTNLTDGMHYWNVTCFDDLGNFRLSQTSNFTINQPDVLITADKIIFNNTNPNKNETINITLNVSNIGGLPVNNLLVEFYDGEKQSGLFIANTTVTVQLNSSSLVSVLWNITLGNHEIWAYLDPYNAVAELNETNNNATNNLTVLYPIILLPQNATWTRNITNNITSIIQDYKLSTLNYSIYIDGRFNSTYTTSDNVTNIYPANLSEGMHSIIVEGTGPRVDYLGQLSSLYRKKNTTSLVLYVDFTNASVIFKTLNNTWFSTLTPTIEFNVTDNLAPIINYTIFQNNVYYLSNLSQNNTALQVTLSTPTQQAWDIIIQTMDLAGNFKNSTPLRIYSDTTPPQPYLTTQNNTNSSDNTPEIFFNITDNLASTINFTFYIDGIIKSTNGSVSNATPSSVNLTALSDGYHNITLEAFDLAGNKQNSSTISILIDTKPPTITIENPNLNSAYGYIISLLSTVTDSGVGISKVTYTLKNDTNLLYQSGQLNLSQTWDDIWNSSEFINESVDFMWVTFNVTANDTLGNKNSTSVRFLVDNKRPSIVFFTPNGQDFNNDFYLDIRIQNRNLTNSTYNITTFAGTLKTNNSNFSINNPTFNWTDLIQIPSAQYPEGLYNISVYSSDSVGNFRIAYNYFRIDRTPPQVSLVWPFMFYNSSASSINFNFTTSDNFDNSMVCNLTINGTLRAQNIDALNGTYTNITISNLAEGRLLWNVTCIDNAGNINTTQTWNFTLDRTPPAILLLSPTNNTFTNNLTVNFSFVPSDNLLPITSCTLIINSTANATLSSVQMGQTNSIQINLSEGIYNWGINCTDLVGNVGSNYSSTSPRILTVDATSPTPSITTQNNSWFKTLTPNITFLITDNIDPRINYTFYINNSANITGFALNNIVTSQVLGTLEEKDYSLILNAIDDANNTRNSSSITIMVDIQQPNISLSWPLNNSNQTRREVVFNFSAVDNRAPLLLCNLSIDGRVNLSSISLSNPSNYSSSSMNLSYGVHNWSVSCMDNATNVGQSGFYYFNIIPPDIVITSANITVNQTTLEENRPFNLFANIYNIGQGDADSFKVGFYLNDPDFGGTQIGENYTISLQSNQNVTLNVTTFLGIGDFTIFVQVDRNNIIYESNESNNKANLTLNVGAYQIIYGNLSGSLVLRLNSSNVFTWDYSNATSGTIFVVDTDNAVSWGSLKSFGKNATDGLSNNDFSEFDSKLFMQNLSESINRTWVLQSNGQPKAVTDMLIFNRIMADVPIVNSTNSSNFVTGILWDKADNPNGEYNGTQDVVFVSPINKAKQGKYGTYDFEMRVPARLRSYTSPNNENTVSIYVELR